MVKMHRKPYFYKNFILIKYIIYMFLVRLLTNFEGITPCTFTTDFSSISQIPISRLQVGGQVIQNSYPWSKLFYRVNVIFLLALVYLILKKETEKKMSILINESKCERQIKKKTYTNQNMCLFEQMSRHPLH